MLPFLKIIIGGEFKTHRSLKQQPQFILVANHNSHLDTEALLSQMPYQKIHRVRPVAAQDYFAKSWQHRLFFRFLMNTLPIDRKSAEGRKNSISLLVNALDRGDSLIFFPEGSRSTSNELQEFKPGVVRVLRQRPHIPFIPAYLKSSSKVLPKGDPIVVPHQFQLTIGDAHFIDPHQSEQAHIQLIRNKVSQLMQ